MASSTRIAWTWEVTATGSSGGLLPSHQEDQANNHEGLSWEENSRGRQAHGSSGRLQPGGWPWQGTHLVL